MPLFHPGPSTVHEQALEARRSGASGCHVWINSGLAWCRHRLGWWRGTATWLRIGRPETGKAAYAALALAPLSEFPS